MAEQQQQWHNMGHVTHLTNYRQVNHGHVNELRVYGVWKKNTYAFIKKLFLQIVKFKVIILSLEEENNLLKTILYPSISPSPLHHIHPFNTRQ